MPVLDDMALVAELHELLGDEPTMDTDVLGRF
jgi:hypothetical protein